VREHHTCLFYAAVNSGVATRKANPIKDSHGYWAGWLRSWLRWAGISCW